MGTGNVRNMYFYCKNKNEKLVNLVGFITRIYHDARLPGRQMSRLYAVTTTKKNSLPLGFP